MKSDRASRTAAFVTLGRAMADAGISHVAGFRDPTARVFLDERARRSLTGAERAAAAGKGGMRLEMARRMADMMALRTSAIDAAVREAIAGGVRQLVVLGAGYDGRAWRMPELAGVRVFEIDHPATQAEKRRRLAELPAPFGAVELVPIDFERESLASALGRAGHDAQATTCWIWEGVVMYLTVDAMRATLAGIAGRSAPGSTLIVNYHAEGRSLFASLMFRLIGEPMISHWTPAQIAAEIHSVGFDVQEDSGMRDWNARFAAGKAQVDRGSYMRIVVARKRSGTRG